MIEPIISTSSEFVGVNESVPRQTPRGQGENFSELLNVRICNHGLDLFTRRRTPGSYRQGGAGSSDSRNCGAKHATIGIGRRSQNTGQQADASTERAGK